MKRGCDSKARRSGSLWRRDRMPACWSSASMTGRVGRGGTGSGDAAELASVESAGVQGEADDELAVGLTAPKADVLHGEVDGHRVGDLVLNPFEDRNLAFDSGGLFPNIVDVR